MLPQMLEEATKTTKKQRPESSTPAKLKAANQNKAARLDQTSSEKYSEADSKEEEDYEDSPRVKDINDLRKEAEEQQYSDEELDGRMPNESPKDQEDEDKMIDCAEKIFVRIADEMVKKQISVRQLLNPYI